MKPIVFYTFVSDNYYEPVGTPRLINSFKRFHPDIPLVIFRQDYVDKIIDPKKKFMGGSVNWLNAKPMFARLLIEKYELVVNVDADSIFTGRLDELIDDKTYDVGSVMNFNDYENVKVDNVTEEQYLQAGLVASRRPEFWDIWMNLSLKENWRCRCAENDTLNLLVYNQLIPQGWKLKVFDKEKDYWGCKLLGREKECEVKGDKLMCRGEQVKLYHAAKGPRNLPKLSDDKLTSYGFNHECVDFMHFLGDYGTSVIYATL
jgi:hypothetical protein